MKHSSEENGRDDAGSSTAPHSARVRLEVAFLDTDEVPATSALPSTHDEGPRLTVLVVAGEADIRRYVRECLAELVDVRLLEAATAAAGVGLAETFLPDFLIADESDGDGAASLSHLRAIILVDDVPHGAPQGPHRRLLARPFSAGELLAEIGKLLG